MTTQEKLIKTN